MNVLLASDSSSHAHAAAKYLAAIPFRKPIKLDIVSAVSPPMVADMNGLGMPLDLNLFVTQECEAAQERVAKTATELESPVLHAHTHVPIGPPASELLRLADQLDSELIVLGAVGHSALARVLLGSVSDYVATHADASALVVRPMRDSNVEPKLSKMLIALSGRPEDQRMVAWLRKLKLRPNVEVHLVRILELNTLYRQDIRQKASEFWQSQKKHAETQILEFETTLQSMGLNTETHLVEATHVGEALINYAEQHGCELVMVGDSDSGLLTRLFLGSTSRYVLRHARCSVLIVRDKHDRQSAKGNTVVPHRD